MTLHEAITKAAHTADLLAQDIAEAHRAAIKASPLFAEAIRKDLDDARERAAQYAMYATIIAGEK